MNDRFPQLQPTPTGYKLWFVFVVLVGLSSLGLIAWVVVRLVTHFT